MELKPTNHSYYCNDANYYVGNVNGENHGRCEYETWEDFKDSWLGKDLSIDHDYNHCFRYDIVKQYDSKTDIEREDKFSLKLYFILQRKGNFIPVTIKEITEEDMPEIENYLTSCWEYLKTQWEEFTK
jgi:hypothetical protein